jgi:uncharacterized protein YggE
VAICSVRIVVSAQIQQVQQPGAPDSIAGLGTATIKVAPDSMRMVLQLPAEGKTLKDAMAKMGQRKESAKKKLAALGAAENDVTFEDLRADTPNPQQLMQQALQARMGMAKKPAAPAGAPTVRLLVTLKARWPLSGKSPEELFAASQELQEKIKSADLAELKQASAEERERLEEQQGGAEINFGMPPPPPPGEPSFSFSARIADDQIAAATQQAFKIAREKARQLATGAGVELGNLKQLSSTLVPDVDASQNSYLQIIQAAQGSAQQSGADDPNEATGNQPTSIKMRMMVWASFAIK